MKHHNIYVILSIIFFSFVPKITIAVEQAEVSSVVDGDTIKVQLGTDIETVRIIGIDTPETVHPTKPVQCFGREASAKMKELVNGRNVTLENDPEEDRGKYGRLLRYVHINGEDIGAMMIRDGYAFSYKQYPHPRLEEYNTFEKEAILAERGLWGIACAHENTELKEAMRSSLQRIQQLGEQINENHKAVSDLKKGYEQDVSEIAKSMVSLVRDVKSENNALKPRVRNGQATQDEQKKYQGNLNVLERILKELDGDDLLASLLSEKMEEACLKILKVNDELITIDVCKERLFSDIYSSHNYYPAIAWGKNTGILNGYPDGSFGAERSVNRAEFLKIVLGASGVNVESVQNPSGFPDVDEEAWYAPFIRYAKAQNIVKGYTDGTFRPEQPVNAAEALKMAYEALGVPTGATNGAWFERYLQHAQGHNTLFSNAIDMDSDMSRQDVVWIVWKLSPQKHKLAPVKDASKCDIKGNITWDGKEKIYHFFGCGSYNKTVIDTTKDEQWFCSEQDAISAGWRKAENCP